MPKNKATSSEGKEEKLLPHGVDVYKEDLDGEYWWLQDNDYLYRGYRTKLSFGETFKSLFHSHNETMNIWTHLIGAIMFIYFIYLTYAIPVESILPPSPNTTLSMSYGYESAGKIVDRILPVSQIDLGDLRNKQDRTGSDGFIDTKNGLSSEGGETSTKGFFSLFSLSQLHEQISALFIKKPFQSTLTTLKHASLDSSTPSTASSQNSTIDIPRWPIVVFIACAIWCLGGSATFHHFYCLSFTMSNVLQTIDYCGICILISGSYVPIIYYGFYCYPGPLKFHLITVITINVLNVCIMATPTFRSPAYRRVRAISFTAVACYAFIALIHIYLLDGWNNPVFTESLAYVFAMGGIYILGAFFYGSRIPEKFKPGHFDYVLSSHQIFHVCIVIAAFFHFVASYQIFLHRMQATCTVH